MEQHYHTSSEIKSLPPPAIAAKITQLMKSIGACNYHSREFLSRPGPDNEIIGERWYQNALTVQRQAEQILVANEDPITKYLACQAADYLADF
ncbi:MAG: hypothetical protein ACREGA_01110 [Candidatus Saccharimonadales bacterium]